MAAEINEGKAARLKSPERWRKHRAKLCDALGCVTPALPRESFCAYHLRLFERRGPAA